MSPDDTSKTSGEEVDRWVKEDLASMREVRRAISDPGRYVRRGQDDREMFGVEPLVSWQARAVMAALQTRRLLLQRFGRAEEAECERTTGLRRGHLADLEVIEAILRSDPREEASEYAANPRAMADAVRNMIEDPDLHNPESVARARRANHD